MLVLWSVDRRGGLFQKYKTVAFGRRNKLEVSSCFSGNSSSRWGSRGCIAATVLLREQYLQLMFPGICRIAAICSQDKPVY